MPTDGFGAAGLVSLLHGLMINVGHEGSNNIDMYRWAHHRHKSGLCDFALCRGRDVSFAGIGAL
jgi:hypothetical protein